MQATSKVFDEAIEPILVQSNKLLVTEVDPDEFKKFMYEEQEELDGKESLDAPLMSPMQLIQPKPFLDTNVAVENVKAIEPTNQILDVLFENIGLLITHIQSQGVQTTSLVIHDENSLLNLTEIIVECFDTAPGVLNIEIKTCSKLQELLIKQHNTLFLRAQSFDSHVKVQRLDVSTFDNKEYISGTKLKKVTMNEAGQNDTQT